MDKNKDKNKKGVVEYFDNDEDEESEQEEFKENQNDLMNETGIEEFLIKDKFSKLHDIIHEYQSALERNRAEVKDNPKKE